MHGCTKSSVRQRLHENCRPLQPSRQADWNVIPVRFQGEGPGRKNDGLAQTAAKTYPAVPNLPLLNLPFPGVPNCPMSDAAEPLSHSPIRKLSGVQIVGTGSFLPPNVVTNDDLASLGCDADWILQRTGIQERRHAPPEMTTSDMAVSAAQNAIEAAGVAHRDIDLLLMATMTPDYLLPSTATQVQHQLGLNCGAVDLSAACAGFLYAMVTGFQYVATGCSRRALIIGADINSRITNPQDKRTYPLFGDGAGAVVLAPGDPEQGLDAYTLGADGSGTELLKRPVGGSKQPFAADCTSGERWYMEMDGRSVFKWAVRLVEDSSKQILEAAECPVENVRLWLFHQANERILEAVVESMSIDRKKVVMHLDHYGNTSTGSIPIALDESVRAGRISPGDRLLLCGFGAGLSWGTALLSW